VEAVVSEREDDDVNGCLNFVVAALTLAAAMRACRAAENIDARLERTENSRPHPEDGSLKEAK